MKRKSILDKFDITTLVLSLILVAIGIVAIYSATYANTSGTSFYIKQLIFAFVGLVLIFAVMQIPPHYIASYSYYLYGFTILLLIAVLVFGKTINGNKSWFYIAGFGIQPSEFTKITTLLAISRYLNFGEEKKDINKPMVLIKTLAFILLPVILIRLQHDTGTAIIFLVMSIPVLWAAGLSPFVLFAIISPVVLAVLSFLNPIYFYIGLGLTIIILFFFKKNLFASIIVFAINIVAGISVNFIFSKLAVYQQQRIYAMFDPSADPLKSGYNIIQSKVAIGSGGLFGKGYLQGTQTQLKFIPEQWTDFIFCMIGEEFGFIGSIIVILIFCILIYRIINTGLETNNRYMSLITIGFGGLFLFHLIINIGMTVGIFPVIGIPLPLISSGVSSLLSFMTMIGLTLNTYKTKNQYI